MRVLCCLDGTNTERLVQQAFDVLSINDLRLLLLHIIDSGPGHEIERIRQRHLGMRQRHLELLGEMTRAEQEQGEEILATAQATFRAQWPGHAPEADMIAEVLLRGQPEEEIIQISKAMPIDLIIIGNRRVQGPRERPHPLGPKSIGHVARFVLDHAPCPVLLLRP